jgi:hypothetical protein
MNIGQSFAHILSRRLEAVEGNDLTSYRRALLRKLSSYKSSHSTAPPIYIRHPKQLVLPPYFEKAIPHTQKTVPHAGILTKHLRKTTFEMFLLVSNVVLAFRER